MTEQNAPNHSTQVNPLFVDGVYPLIGRCIYCPATKGLTDEHVIPYGLLPRGESGWILRGASCKRCAKITSGFEHAVLRRLLGGPRAVLDLRTRRPRERPTSFKLSIEREGQMEDVTLPVGQFPATLIFPTFVPPAYLDGRPYKGGIDINGTVTFQVGGPPIQQVASSVGTKRLQFTAMFKEATFERFLIKIAYCFAVLRLGLSGIDQPYVLSPILESTNDMGRWLGCDGQEMLSRRFLHSLGIVIVQREIICRVKLFASSGAPEYVVIVGLQAWHQGEA